jgi:hypothetical protein
MELQKKKIFFALILSFILSFGILFFELLAVGLMDFQTNDHKLRKEYPAFQFHYLTGYHFKIEELNYNYDIGIIETHLLNESKPNEHSFNYSIYNLTINKTYLLYQLPFPMLPIIWIANETAYNDLITLPEYNWHYFLLYEVNETIGYGLYEWQYNVIPLDALLMNNTRPCWTAYHCNNPDSSYYR